MMSTRRCADGKTEKDTRVSRGLPVSHRYCSAEPVEDLSVAAFAADVSPWMRPSVSAHQI